jgi:TIR domain-containing protein
VLTASERIKLIQAVAPILAAEEWSLIDLTLRQFKLPNSDMWDGNDRDGYVARMIDEASDEVLIELASHMGIENASRPSNIEPDFWLPDHLRLFLSHLAKDKKQATLLQTNLHTYQISAFIAHKDIAPTKKWQDEIELALSTADALVALLTPGFHESKWTDQEIGFALGRSLPILGIRLGEDPYGFLAREQAIQGIGVKPDKLARSIFGVFLKNKQTRKRMAQSLASCFTSSHSFQQAKDNFSLLEHAEYWDEKLSASVAAAVKHNSQVRDAFGVPERVKLFLKQQGSKR